MEEQEKKKLPTRFRIKRMYFAILMIFLFSAVFYWFTFKLEFKTVEGSQEEHGSRKDNFSRGCFL
ncbi:MAG: hypothetical protein ACQESA_02250 [Patescibacteria group bacterium]